MSPPAAPRAAELRVTCRAFMLTYSRAAEDEDQARSMQCEITDKVLALFPDSSFTCGVEQHTEPGDKPYHIHCGVVRASSKHTKIGKRLDCQGVHPNIKPHANDPSSRRACLEYPYKEDRMPMFNWDSLDDVAGEAESVRGEDGLTRAEQAYLNAAAAVSADDALELIRQNAPRDYVLYGKTIKSHYTALFRPKYQHEFTADQFNRPLVDWDALPGRASPCFVGASGVGKTAYAMAHFTNPLLVTHKDKLKQFDPETHDGIVFDEFSCQHWPLDAIKNLMDRDHERDIDVKCSVVTLPAKTKRIFVIQMIERLRPGNFWCLSQDDQDSITSRQAVYTFTNKLWNIPDPTSEDEFTTGD